MEELADLWQVNRHLKQRREPDETGRFEAGTPQGTSTHGTNRVSNKPNAEPYRFIYVGLSKQGWHGQWEILTSLKGPQRRPPTPVLLAKVTSLVSLLHLSRAGSPAATLA